MQLAIGPALAIIGESGVGKSALLANWAAEYRKAHPDDFLLQHFIGATPASTDWAAMVRRILGEFNRRFHLKIEIPDKPDALRSTFANALYMAATRGRIVLVLDALNQLEDCDQAPDLVWLPLVLPVEVRLIVSTLPGRALEGVHRRNWPTLTIEPLHVDERRRLIAEYLQLSAHTLSRARVERLAQAPQAANPLYLRALLQELLACGRNDTLEVQIGHYLAAATVPELFQKILTRYEKDYERERPHLVRDAMVLLWAARRGLAEAELMDLLGTGGQPLPRAHWSPLYLAAEGSLVSRSGLLGFAHDHLREAVKDEYFANPTVQQAGHLRLAQYFERRYLDTRKVDELPWQLAEARSWERLAAALTEPALFGAAWEKNQFEVKAYWTKVESHSPVRMVESYRSVLEVLNIDTDHTWRVATLLADAGHSEEALLLRSHLVEHYARICDKSNLEAALGNQANVLYVGGQLEQALFLHKKEEAICLELGNKDGLQACYGNQALILQDWGRLKEAMALHKKEEAICLELGNKEGLSASYCNQTLVRWETPGSAGEAVEV